MIQLLCLMACIAIGGMADAQGLSNSPAVTQPPLARDLADYRSKYPTTLTQHGPPPKVWQSSAPLVRPADVDEVTYQSGGLELKAWVSRLPQDGQSHPAVVFCHGGFWFGTEDWTVLKPFLDAGFIVMAPRVRAENGNPGEFECFYGEVDDIIAAGKYLQAIHAVDKDRVFVSGHSAGGTLATLAVMKDNPFAMSAPIGAMLDVRATPRSTSERQRELIVFDGTNLHELESRSALLFTASLRKPIVLFCGDKDPGLKTDKQFVALAHRFNREVPLNVVPGDHFQSLPNSIPQIIKTFKAFKPGASSQ